jgi:hypothetical protein
VEVLNPWESGLNRSSTQPCVSPRLNGTDLRINSEKPRPRLSMCGTIKIVPCSKILSVEHRPKFLHPFTGNGDVSMSVRNSWAGRKTVQISVQLAHKHFDLLITPETKLRSYNWPVFILESGCPSFNRCNGLRALKRYPFHLESPYHTYGLHMAERCSLLTLMFYLDFGVKSQAHWTWK